MDGEDEVKEFLKLKYEECNRVLKKLKIKNKRLKIIYVIIIVFCVISQATITIVSSIIVPPLLVPILSGITAVLTGLSSAFKIRETKLKIAQKIEEIKKLKSYIEIMNLSQFGLDESKIEEIINTLI
jgi:hypothetical protein